MEHEVTIALAEELLARGRSEDVARMLDPVLEEASETGAVRIRLLRARLYLLAQNQPERAARLLEPLRDGASIERTDSLLGARIRCELGWLGVWRNPTPERVGEALAHLRAAAETFRGRSRPRPLTRALLGEVLACRRLGTAPVGAGALREAAVLVPQLGDHSIASWWTELRRTPPAEAAEGGQGEAERLLRELRAEVPAEPALAHASEAMRPVVRRIADCAAACHPVLLVGERGSGRRALGRALHAATGRTEREWSELEAAPELPGTGTARRTDGQEDGAGDARGGPVYVRGLGRCDAGHAAALVKRLVREARSASDEEGPPVVGSVRPEELDPELRATLERRFPHWIEVPPLRRRPADLPLLARHLLRNLQPPEAPPAVLTDEALRTLAAYRWPGNVRQLRNELERALAHQGGEPAPVIESDHLAPEIRRAGGEDGARKVPAEEVASRRPDRLRLRPDEDLEDALARSERRLVHQALAEHDGHVASAARRLGLTRQGLYKKMKRLNVERGRFTSPTATAN